MEEVFSVSTELEIVYTCGLGDAVEASAGGIGRSLVAVVILVRSCHNFGILADRPRPTASIHSLPRGRALKKTKDPLTLKDALHIAGLSVSILRPVTFTPPAFKSEVLPILLVGELEGVCT